MMTFKFTVYLGRVGRSNNPTNLVKRLLRYLTDCNMAGSATVDAVWASPYISDIVLRHAGGLPRWLKEGAKAFVQGWMDANAYGRTVGWEMRFAVPLSWGGEPLAELKAKNKSGAEKEVVAMCAKGCKGGKGGGRKR